MRLPGDIGRWLAPVSLVALISVGHLAYGAASTPLALALASLEGLLLLGFMANTGLRAAVGGIKGLRVLALLFAAVLLIAAFSLTPFTPGGPHPVWTYASAPAASTVDRSATLGEMLKLTGLACVFVMGAVIGRDLGLTRRLMHAALAAGALFALYCIGLFITGHQAVETNRLGGSLVSANVAGQLFGMLLVLSLPLFAPTQAKRVRGSAAEQAIVSYGPAAGLVLLFGVCLALTASRGAAIATALAVVLFVGLQVEARRMKARTALISLSVAALGAAGVLMTSGASALLRWSALGGDSGGRGLIMGEHWKAFLASPLFGYGLGGFAAVNKLILDAGSYETLWRIRSAHNVYLQWLEEAGLLGAIPMFLCIGAIILFSATALGVLRQGGTWLRALLAVDLLVLVHGLTDFGLQAPSVAAFWAVLLGVQLGLARPKLIEAEGRRRTVRAASDAAIAGAA